MSKKVYVGKLSYSVGNRELEEMFAPYGTVKSANVIMDRQTGRSKGFGFVEMSTEQEARTAISALHGKNSGGQSLTVNEARPREERSGGERSGGGGDHFGGRRRY